MATSVLGPIWSPPTLYGQLYQSNQQQAMGSAFVNNPSGRWTSTSTGRQSLLSESKTVMAKIKEEFKKLSSKPIVKEIMPGLIKLKKEEVSIVVNEMLAV